eukprot:7423647-Ditylum_brightwellii.AAC.1
MVFLGDESPKNCLDGDSRLLFEIKTLKFWHRLVSEWHQESQRQHFQICGYDSFAAYVSGTEVKISPNCRGFNAEKVSSEISWGSSWDD